MSNLLIKRKQILKRDFSLFGIYANYLVNGISDGNELSERQRLSFFRNFVEELSQRVKCGYKISVPGSYVILPVEHDFLASKSAAQLLINLASLLEREKINLILELKDGLPEAKSKHKLEVAKRALRTVYALHDAGMLFGLRYEKQPNVQTLRIIEARLFSFVTLGQNLRFHNANNESYLVKLEELRSVLTHLQCASVLVIADDVCSRDDLLQVSNLPFFFYSGEFLCPARVSSLS